MLEGFQPLDLSFLGSGSATSAPRNRVGLSQGAMEILGRSKWNDTPIEDLYNMGTVKQPTPHKQTVVSRVLDLLSMPAYAVANAADNAIAGHQASDSDSVLSDIGQVIGGLATGTLEGVKAGIRGGFGSSESAIDPKDKIFLDAPMIRWDLGMSEEEAKKPENRELVRQRLKEKVEKNKITDLSSLLFSQHPIRTSELEKYNDFSDEAIDEYFRSAGVGGAISSAVADPLNVMGTGVKGVPAVTAEIPEITGTTEKLGKANEILEGLNTGTPRKPPLPDLGRRGGSYEVIPKNVQNAVASGSELVKPPAWFDFPKSAEEVSLAPKVAAAPTPVPVNEFDDILDSILIQGTSRPDIAKNLERVERGAGKLGEKLAPAPVHKDQIKLAQQLSNNPERFRTNIMKSLIAGKSPNIAEAPIIDAFVNKMLGIKDLSARLKHPGERAKIVSAVDRVITAQADALKQFNKVESADNIINTSTELGTLPVGIPQGPKFISKNPVRDAEYAQQVFDKFAPQITGDKLPAGIGNSERYRKAIANGTTTRYSGEQQVQMWNHLSSVILKNVKTPNRFALTNNILKKVEDMFIAEGKIPMSQARIKAGKDYPNPAIPLRLSQVLEVLGPAATAMSNTLLTKILRGDPKALSTLSKEQIQALEALKANEALVDAQPTVTAINAVKDMEELTPKGPLSAARETEQSELSARVASDIATSAGASPRGAQIAADTFIAKNPINRAVESTLNTTALISHPDVSPKLLAKYSNAPAVTRAIAAQIGSPNPSILGRMVGQKTLVPEWLGARFNAAYKNPDMRVHYLRNAASAKFSVSERAKYLNDLAKRFPTKDVDLWNDALKGAQGKIAPVAGSPAAELSQEFLKVMENIFGSSGLRAGVALENSVAGRAQLFMGELNKAMKRYGLPYKFSKAGDYEEGAKWLNSWEQWDIKNPLEFLFRIQNVVENVTREKTMFDEIAARFGVAKDKVPKNGRGEFRHTVIHPRLQGYYFGPEAASQINQFVKNLNEMSKPSSSKLMQQFDHVLSRWKAAVTIYVPSHHIRNMIGDVYVNWLGGVDDIHDYTLALKTMRSQAGRYPTLSPLSPKLPPVLGGRPPTAAGNSVAFTMRNGEKITNDKLYIAAIREGLLPTTRVLEDIPDDVALGIDKFRPFGGKVQEGVHNFSEARDHYVRLAQFSNSIRHSAKGFEAAVTDAAYLVRKYHPDGMDLTAFERNVMRRVFPFYSWTRKAIPLIVESLVATPGKVMAYPKLQYGIQQYMGIDTQSISDPFPVDQLFPDWIREKGVGPIFGEAGGYGIINPSNPTMDILSQYGEHPVAGSLNMLNPVAKIPLEVGSGVKMGSQGIPVEASDPDYWASQIPGISHLGRASGQLGTSDTVKEQGFPNWPNIINMLTAAGLTNTGQYQKSGQFDLRDYMKSQR